MSLLTTIKSEPPEQVGRITISSDFIDSPKYLPIIAMGFAKLESVVLQCEHFYHTRSFHYILYSPKFRKLKPNEQIPYYELLFHKDEAGEITITVNEQPDQNRIYVGSFSITIDSTI